jgi:threonine dehydratase
MKAENLQRMGAFKFRGGYNSVNVLGDAERARGVVAFSSGNHAQAVALAAQLHGCRATIVMPQDAPALKLAATRGYGAEVIVYDRYKEDRAAIAQRLTEERGAALIPPYDHLPVMAGAGGNHVGDQAQHGGVQRVIQISDGLIGPVYRQGVLDQVIGAYRQVVEIAQKLLHHEGRSMR